MDDTKNSVVGPPNRLNVLQKTAVIFIRGYQLTIGQLLPPACRFEPSCSVYTMRAIELHGFLRGGALGARRILRCNPFSKGGFDPVPGRR